MGDFSQPEKPSADTKIEVESTQLPVGPPQNYQYQQPYYQQQPPQQGPYYQQQVGGQKIYYEGHSQQPYDVSRNRPPYRPPDPEQQNFAGFGGDETFTEGFDSIKIRNRFVQRVYTILSIQLGFSFGFLLLVTFVGALRVFIFNNLMVLMILSMIGYMGTTIALICCGDLRRQFPTNFILLGALTICMTGLMSVIVAMVPPVTVLAAMGTTFLVCTVISLCACQTKYDITGCGGCLCVCTLVLVIYGFILTILLLCGIYIKFLHILYSAIACLLFCAWLMYDTQMVMGGRRLELSPEEYIIGALTLYVDIMIIFMHILNLFNECMRA